MYTYIHTYIHIYIHKYLYVYTHNVGLNIKVADVGLRPRLSSAIIVHEAVRHILKLQGFAMNGKDEICNRGFRILDLGCGSGALLLAACKEGASIGVVHYHESSLS
jgi:methylase of polypeptide subunit release factors